MDKKKFGSRLRELRKKHTNYTMKEFGAIFNLAESTISGYENGARTPDIEILHKFADYFDVDLDFLTARTEKPVNQIKKAKEILEDPNTQIAARDGDMTEEKALEALEWLLEKEKGRKPGDRQPKRK
ncbi:helix-turn-helix transcriptional regulator [Sutcliffiella sp. FSL R7-0096]|uniref:helix-turn-helix domain-containing protein n=1 Tax=Sutcliffiella sp. FSL R7-0096 TaxID=2921670 RepID=UPI00315AA612